MREGVPILLTGFGVNDGPGFDGALSLKFHHQRVPVPLGIVRPNGGHVPYRAMIAARQPTMRPMIRYIGTIPRIRVRFNVGAE